MKPRFRAGDFAGGIEAGTEAIISTVRGEPFRGTGYTAPEPAVSWSDTLRALLAWGPFLLLAVSVLLWLRQNRDRIAKAQRLAARMPGSLSLRSSDTDWPETSLSDTSSSSSTSSDSSFSGGGGSGGGGGASDSW